MESHLINHHLANVSNQYGCESCQKSYPNRDDLQRHLIDVHSKHFYKCQLCSSIFDSQSNLREHLAHKHCSSCKIYTCKQCNQSCLNEDEFKIHFRLHFSPANIANNLAYHHHIHPSIPHLSSPVSSSSPSVHHSHPSLPHHPPPPPHHHHHNHSSNLFFSSLKPYLKCTLCGDEFHSEYQLEKHYENSHPARRSPQSPTSATSPKASSSSSSPSSSGASISASVAAKSVSKESRKRIYEDDNCSNSDRESINSSPPQTSSNGCRGSPSSSLQHPSPINRTNIPGPSTSPKISKKPHNNNDTDTLPINNTNHTNSEFTSISTSGKGTVIYTSSPRSSSRSSSSSQSSKADSRLDNDDDTVVFDDIKHDNNMMRYCVRVCEA